MFFRRKTTPSLSFIPEGIKICNRKKNVTQLCGFKHGLWTSLSFFFRFFFLHSTLTKIVSHPWKEIFTGNIFPSENKIPSTSFEENFSSFPHIWRKPFYIYSPCLIYQRQIHSDKINIPVAVLSFGFVLLYWTSLKDDIILHSNPFISSFSLWNFEY